MMHTRITGTAVRAALAGALALLLTGCMLVPGKFASELVLLRSGAFTYSYTGEIHLLSMGKLARMGADQANSEFTAEECYDQETFEPRECTAEELAQQRAAFDQHKAERAANKAKEADDMKKLFGGIDPTNPASGAELAKRIERQAGFESVAYKGDGLFDVRFKVSGRLDHDFVFPTFERLPLGNYFLLAGRRDDGTVRIDAPGFVAFSGANPMQAMAGWVGPNDDGSAPARAPLPDGTFAVVTDGEILANNTDEGPAADPRGKMLTWAINAAADTPPTALIRLD